MNDRQKRLVEAVRSGLSIDEAGEVAGYEDPGNLALATRSPLVQAELKAIRQTQIKAKLAQKAMKAIENLIDSEGTPAATRFSAAKWVLEQAGHTNSQAEVDDKPLHEMTEKELLAFMAKAERAIKEGGSAPIINVTPDNGA